MIRISLGIASLIVSILFAAHALGLIPDRDGAILRGRKDLCESVAIAGSHRLVAETRCVNYASVVRHIGTSDLGSGR